MFTESEYEEWFHKYLGDVESPFQSEIHSPLENIPKPFNNKKWTKILLLSFLLSLALSLLLSWENAQYNKWILSWLSEALLNISLGLLVSIFIFAFTNSRDRNIAYYTDIIPLLKKRYEDMKAAYYTHHFKLQIYYQKGDFESYYWAWHAHVNACLTIVGFFEFLLDVLPFKTESFAFNKTDLRDLEDELSTANNNCQNDFFKGQKIITKKTYILCFESENKTFDLLMSLNCFIQEIQQRLYNTKYSKKRIKK